MLTEIRGLRLPMPRSANMAGSRGGKYIVPPSPEPLYRQLCRTRVDFYDHYLHADGTPSAKNIDNNLKILMDAVAKAYGTDDRWLDWRLELQKYVIDESVAPYCVVDIGRL